MAGLLWRLLAPSKQPDLVALTEVPHTDLEGTQGPVTGDEASLFYRCPPGGTQPAVCQSLGSCGLPEGMNE